LRERLGDIDVLVQYFIQRNNEQMGKRVSGISREALKAFTEYTWPGNIRELEHLMESTMNLIDKDMITLEDVQYYFEKRQKIEAIDSEASVNDACPKNLSAAVSGYERSLLVKALKSSGGNVAMAARALQLPKQTMHNKVKKHNISITREIE
jgi:arginine utilization regulatory protein